MSGSIDEAEIEMMDLLRKGMYYSSTGIDKVQDLSLGKLPYTVKGQNPDFLVTDLEEFQLIFDFAKATEAGARLLWMYHLEGYAPKGNWDGGELTRYKQRVTGYFKLKTDEQTRLDLGHSWDKDELCWIRFEAIDPENPQKRIWFNPIKGKLFGQDAPGTSDT